MSFQWPSPPIPLDSLPFNAQFNINSVANLMNETKSPSSFCERSGGGGVCIGSGGNTSFRSSGSS